jgi:chemotaxis protein MotC
MRRALICLFIVIATSVGHTAGVLESLRPAQTLDALRRVQDSIAIGDARALPLQAELISIMDKSFAAALNAGNSKQLDPELVLAFALAGGSRAVFSSFTERTKFEPDEDELVKAVSAYLKGDVDKAQQHFEKVDVQKLGPRLAPFVALAKGTSNVRKQPDLAIRHFDLARTLAPATLIEEVALRRAISVHADSLNAAKFLKASEQYARRFVQSPYAAQFAEGFVSGTMRMGEAISGSQIDGVLRPVEKDRRNTLYLRLAREAVIAGRLPLAAHTAAAALQDGELAKVPARAAQIRLYAIIPELTKLEGHELSRRIAEIDETGLPEEDRPLLDAARGIIEAIGRPFEMVGAKTTLPPANAVPAQEKAGANQAAKMPTNDDPLEQSIAANKEKLRAIEALLEGAN